MQLFRNTVKLRGFLTQNTDAPAQIDADSLTVLQLATVSGIWDLGNNKWIPRTDLHRIFCYGPYFCGFLRGMRRGDYLEVAGELHSSEQERHVVVAGGRFTIQEATCAVHAVHIRRLDRPDALVDYGDSDDNNRQQRNREVQP